MVPDGVSFNGKFRDECLMCSSLKWFRGHLDRGEGADRAPLSQGWSDWRAAAFSISGDAADLACNGGTNLSDPGVAEALHDICSMRAFAGLELGRDAIPDETTILNFRHLLERHELTKSGSRRCFEASGGPRCTSAWRHHRRRDADRGITVDEERGAKARSRDACQSKKGNQRNSRRIY